MTKKDRINKAYNYLKNIGVIHTQKDMAERMEATAPNVSSALKGVDTVLTDKFLCRFNEAFDNIFNDEWLLTGEGSMLKSPISQTANGDHNTQVAGNANHVNNSSTLDKALDEISQQRQLVEKSHELTANAQRQIDRLLAIIEKMQDK